MNLFEDVTFEDLGTDQREVAELIGIENYLKIVDIFGGGAIYIPKPDGVLRSARNRKIIEDYKDGENCKLIAKKYNLTKSAVINILNGGK